MEINTQPIPIKKYSQVDIGALKYRNDCGAGMGMSILSGYKKTLMTVTQFYEDALAAMGLPPGTDAYLSVGAIQKVLRDNGLTTVSVALQSIKDVLGHLYEGRPVGVLINNYGILVDAGLTEFKGFRGAHFSTLVGAFVGKEQYFGVYDPYTSGDKMMVWDVPTFYKAWDYPLVDNPRRMIIVPTTKWVIDSTIPEEPENPPTGVSVYKVVTQSLTIREQPSASAKILGYLHNGDLVNVLQVEPNGWLKLEAGGYCSGNTLYIVKVS